MRAVATKLSEMRPAPWNPRTIDDFQLAALCRSLEEFGPVEPVVLNADGTILGGHQRYEAATRLGWKTLPAVRVDLDDEKARVLNLALNRISGEWDEPLLASILGEIDSVEEWALAGFPADEVERLLASIDGDAPEGGSTSTAPTLAERFVVPPMSILDTRRGYWTERKERWLSLGIRSEEGRSTGSDTSSTQRGALIPSASGRDPMFYRQKTEVEGQLGRELSTREFLDGYYVDPYADRGSSLSSSGTSVFDPVLCELAIRWFSPVGGRVLDPFAGGSVRGIVSSRLGRAYDGIELRAEQIASNEEQARTIAPVLGGVPHWIEGDCRDVLPTLGDDYDLVLSCPPYFDLERYTDDPRDLANMKWAEFLVAYRAIVAETLAHLADDRFVVWVVGDVRDRSGAYRGLVRYSIEAFEAAGARLWNEAILVQMPGSLPARAARPFVGSRKLGKTHQNVLVFVRGSAQRATEACGEVDLSWDEEPEGEPVPI